MTGALAYIRVADMIKMVTYDKWLQAVDSVCAEDATAMICADTTEGVCEDA